jgi:hypothetical protein
MTRTSFTNYPSCHSGSRLDEFVARLFNFKKHGTYVDIGSAHSMQHNNSHYLDVQLDWGGICVEIDSAFNETYNDRKNCMYVNQDATTVNYKQLFTDKGFTSSIDYLSLDVDILCLTVAKMLPLNDFKFKVIGIEHDHYLHGDLYRAPQRELLLNAGYTLVCRDVLVRSPAFDNCSFEDWYLDSSYFGSDIINKLTSSQCHPEDILQKF